MLLRGEASGNGEHRHDDEEAAHPHGDAQQTVIPGVDAVRPAKAEPLFATALVKA